MQHHETNQSPDLREEAEKTYRIIDGNVVVQPSVRNQFFLICGFFLSVLGAGYLNAFYPDLLPKSLTFLPALVCAALVAHRVCDSRVVLTPEYLLYISGMISWKQRSVRLDYARIQEIELNETIIQKLIGTGDVVVTPIATSVDSMITIEGVCHPRLCKDLLREKIGTVSVDIGGVHAMGPSNPE